MSHLKNAKLVAVEQCWASQLVMFDFEILYWPGRKNGNADALSRQNFTGGEQRVVLEEIVTMATVNAIFVFPEFRYRICRGCRSRTLSFHGLNFIGVKEEDQARERETRGAKLVRQHFYWPGMYQDVQNFCKNCLRCIVSKDIQPK